MAMPLTAAPPPPDAQAPIAVPGRIPQLDGLRGIAIGLVVVWHYLVAVPGGETNAVVSLARRLFYLSWSGVDLFFVLSGFLIGGILLDNRDSPRYFRTFYIRRAFRIVPVYLLLLVPFWAAHSALGTSRDPTLSALLGGEIPSWSYLAFVQNFYMAAVGDFGAIWMGITWSLAIEEQFYLLLPLTLFLVPRALVPRLCLACCALALAFRTALALAFHGPSALASAYLLLPSRMDALFLGVLGAWLVREPRWARDLPARRPLLWGAAAFTGAVLSFASVRMTSFVAPLMTTAGYSVLAILYLAVLLLSYGTDRGPLHAALTSRPLRALGYTSYFVYLFHELFLQLGHFLSFGQAPEHSSGARVLVTLASFVALMAAAGLSWRLLEQPLIAEGRKARY